ncbi:MAG: hypothetical protein OEY38_08405 [Gammaproteobacteria bacterium]|nr:hypothetical protein [Gammaproteobacteria bacterium]
MTEIDPTIALDGNFDIYIQRQIGSEQRSPRTLVDVNYLFASRNQLNSELKIGKLKRIQFGSQFDYGISDPYRPFNRRIDEGFVGISFAGFYDSSSLQIYFLPAFDMRHSIELSNPNQSPITNFIFSHFTSGLDLKWSNFLISGPANQTRSALSASYSSSNHPALIYFCDAELDLGTPAVIFSDAQDTQPALLNTGKTSSNAPLLNSLLGFKWLLGEQLQLGFQLIYHKNGFSASQTNRVFELARESDAFKYQLLQFNDDYLFSKTYSSLNFTYNSLSTDQTVFLQLLLNNNDRSAMFLASLRLSFLNSGTLDLRITTPVASSVNSQFRNSFFQQILQIKFSYGL